MLSLLSVLVSLLLCWLLSEKRADVVTCKFFKGEVLCKNISYPAWYKGRSDPMSQHSNSANTAEVPCSLLCVSLLPTAEQASPPALRSWPFVPKEPQTCYWLNHRVVKVVIEISKAVFNVTFDLQSNPGGLELLHNRRHAAAHFGVMGSQGLSAADWCY